jgi:hypothetical protein
MKAGCRGTQGFLERHQLQPEADYPMRQKQFHPEFRIMVLISACVIVFPEGRTRQ